MFRNYLKIAWRNFKRDRQFTFLNLFGLFTGLACTLLIWLWVHDEQAVDKFNQNDSRLYQVLLNWDDGKSISTFDATPGLLATSLRAEYPEMQYSASVIPSSWFDKPGIISFGDKHINAAAQFAGRDYFSIFSIPIIRGNERSMGDMHSVFLSRGLSEKLFGSTDVLGKAITWDQKDFSGPYTIAGVFENPPTNSTVSFDILFNYDLFLLANPKLQKWSNNDPVSFVVLKNDVDPVRFNSKIADYLKTKDQNAKATILLQRFSDRYLYNNYENGVPSGGRIEYLRLFSMIAIFILVIACINFMNLATARASRRMKEVGIKKILGASRFTLIAQYICESLVMSFAALIVAVLAVLVLLPSFNSIVGKQIVFHPDWDTIVAGLSVATIAGLLAGSYPALYLTRFNSASILRGRWVAGISQQWVRKSLVVFQFTISAIFIVAVLVVYQQMQYVQTKNLGYHRDHIVYFEKGGMTTQDAPANYESGMAGFIAEIQKIPGVKSAANFRHNIISREGGTTDLSWEGKDPTSKINFTDIAAGYGFVETLGIEMKAGRSFSASYPAEKSKIVFNEAAIRVMGLKDPVGKTVHLWGEDRQIIGVMKDFNFESLHENLKPCFLDLLVNERASKIMVRIEAGKEKESIKKLSDLYRQFNPGFSFDYRFLDEDFQALYAAENRVSQLSKYFALMAIIISSLGLFGLASFTAQRRKKEMGIRKVIGAKAHQIAILLGRDYLKPVIIAMVVAFPIAWLLMNQWLSGFAYHVKLEPLWFLLATATLMGISLFTVSFQSIKTAMVDPAETLRSE